MRNKQIERLAYGGVLSALVLMLTYFIKVPVPATGGYVHPGDGAVFLAAALLGPYAGLVGGVGSALADLLGGYFVYIAPTFVIKAAMGALAGWLVRPGAHFRNALAFALGASVMVAGYFLFEGIVFGWAAAFSSVGPNALQGVAGVLLGSTLSVVFTKKK